MPSGCKKVVGQFVSAFDASAKKKLCSGTLNGMGGRLYPSRTPKNDAKKACRVDQGHVYDKEAKRYEIVLQPNFETDSSGMKDFISKYSTHAILAKMTIDMNENDGEGPTLSQIRERLLADFERRDDEDDYS